MKKSDVYRQILRDVIKDESPYEDVLLLMVVLHTHSIILRHGVVLEDVRPCNARKNLVLAPLTRTLIAELVAERWGKKKRWGDAAFWFSRYGELTPFEVFEDVSASMRDRAIAARDSIATHALVEEVVPE